VATTPKSDRVAEENEDATAWSLGLCRFAVADGATDSAFSGPWAAALARAFAAEGPAAGSPDFVTALRGWLAPLQEGWRESIPWNRLPWYIEEKARLGAFSTLLGLELDPVSAVLTERDAGVAPGEDPMTWRATAIGDSCLFHWRAGRLLSAFPLRESAGFGNRPYLLSSHPGRNPDLEGFCHRATGRCRAGDQFFLVTDALAQWMLREFEQGRWRAGDLLAAEDEAGFARLIAALRRTEGLRDDDTTLLHVRVNHVLGERRGTAAPSGPDPIARPGASLPR